MSKPAQVESVVSETERERSEYAASRRYPKGSSEPLDMPKWSEDKLRELAKAEEEAGFLGAGDTPYNRAVHAIAKAQVESGDGFAVELPPLSSKAIINDGYDCRLAYNERTEQLKASLQREKGKDEEIERLKGLLREIASIPNSTTGGDWDEIEQARSIANSAFKAAVTGE